MARSEYDLNTATISLSPIFTELSESPLSLTLSLTPPLSGLYLYPTVTQTARPRNQQPACCQMPPSGSISDQPPFLQRRCPFCPTSLLSSFFSSLLELDPFALLFPWSRFFPFHPLIGNLIHSHFSTIHKCMVPQVSSRPLILPVTSRVTQPNSCLWVAPSVHPMAPPMVGNMVCTHLVPHCYCCTAGACERHWVLGQSPYKKISVNLQKGALSKRLDQVLPEGVVITGFGFLSFFSLPLLPCDLSSIHNTGCFTFYPCTR